MFAEKLANGIVGTCELALQDISRPDIKTTKSALMGTTLRVGDVQNKPTESMEIQVKLSKCTAITRPKNWKRVMLRKKDKDKDKDKDGGEGSDQTEDDAEEPMDVDEADTYVELKRRSEYYRDSDKSGDDDDDEGEVQVKEEKSGYDDAPAEQVKLEDDRRVEREELIKGFKYGSTYTPCPDGQFDRLKTKKGIDICGFFKSKNVRAPRVSPLNYRPQILVVSSRMGDGRSSIHLGRSRQSTTTRSLVFRRARDDKSQDDGNWPDGVQGRHGPQNGRPHAMRFRKGGLSALGPGA